MTVADHDGAPRIGASPRGARRVSPAAWLLILPIRFYQKFITPYTPATCRYYPTCSAYAVGALRTHGAAKGLLLAAWRLLRCNPWSSGGVDRVPPRGAWRNPPAPADVDVQPGGDDDVAVVAGPVRDAVVGREAAGNYVIPERAVTSGEAVTPEKTNGGTRAADDTARPCGACAPSAGRTAA